MKKLKRIYVAPEVHKIIKKRAVENDETIQEFLRSLVKAPKKKKGMFEDVF